MLYEVEQGLVVPAGFTVKRKKIGMESSIPRTFLYIIPSSVLSHSPSIIPSPRLFPPQAPCQLNSWPKVSFFALISASYFLKSTHLLSFIVGQILYLLFLPPFSSRTEEKLGSKRRHTEKEHCTELHSSGFLAKVIEFGCAFSNWN